MIASMLVKEVSLENNKPNKYCIEIFIGITHSRGYLKNKFEYFIDKKW